MPLATARKSVVGARSRFSNNWLVARPGQVVLIRPPATAPPTTNPTVPVPWSVPLVPFTRAVRPNSVITSTAVCAQAGPSAVFSATNPASSCFSGLDRRLVCAVWVSQPPISSSGDPGAVRRAQHLSG